MQIRTKENSVIHHKPDPRPCRNSVCSRIAQETRKAVLGASEVHRALCAPETQLIGPYEIASRILPARHVGGDFVCTVGQDDRTIAVLGDLMGKGLSAAMWITHIVDVVHRAAEGRDCLSEVMAALNTEIVNSRVRVPLTSAFAVSIEHATGKLTCAAAGHPPAILLRDGSSTLLNDGGPILGVFPDARFNSHSLELQPGDALIAYSDGLIEEHDEAREEFSLDRALLLLSRLRQTDAVTKLSELIEASRELSSVWPPDDTSLLVIQRR